MPEPGKEKARKVYVFDPSIIADRLLAIPSGVQRVKIDRVATARGKDFTPIALAQLADGRFVIGEGRHRLLEALQNGRRVAARIGRAVSGADVGLVPLTSIVPE